MTRRGKIVNFLVILALFVTIFERCVDSSPCGICGVDVICKDKYPICSKSQKPMIDHCGCCVVCKKILNEEESCSNDIEAYEICRSGLECINNKCTQIKPSN